MSTQTDLVSCITCCSFSITTAARNSRWKTLSRALTVKATGLPTFSCKILFVMKLLSARWPLPQSTSYWFQQCWSWDRHYVTGKYSGLKTSQIQVSERSSFKVCCQQSEGLDACFPRSSPSSWDTQGFIGYLVSAWASRRAGISEYDREPGSCSQYPTCACLCLTTTSSHSSPPPVTVRSSTRTQLCLL